MKLAEGWKRDKAWADRYWPEIERVIRSVAGEIIDVQQADDESDQKRATDYVVSVSAGDIACRIRRWEYWERFADITIRSSRPGPVKTELQKIRDGFGRWYLYAWAYDDGRFGAWVFLDLDKLRTTGILSDAARQYNNHDGSSGFIAIPVHRVADCILQAGGHAVVCAEPLPF